ncbi:glutathione S-transferase A-like [Fukomys damarensis]|uniref:glutathione S-transferase A-like n=1 Tax=Fukomys damarensis TaxID=885580 RepID=UPI001455A6E7|nr:glutathione S-transferase A-like [Fukomys damarensis]
MVGKPVLHYVNVGGRMESIQWLLAAAGVEFEEKFVMCPDDSEKLKKDGILMFQQVPVMEMYGMKLGQTRAILKCIATKYNHCGKDIKERFLIHTYTESIVDLYELFMHVPVTPDQKDSQMALIKDRTQNYDSLGAVVNVECCPQKMAHREPRGALRIQGCSSQLVGRWKCGAAGAEPLAHVENVEKDVCLLKFYLVGNKLSRADIHLVELVYSVEEVDASLLADLPLLQALKTKTSNLPNVKKFWQTGSQRGSFLLFRK